jgi:membrane AbrB-like protein
LPRIARDVGHIPSILLALVLATLGSLAARALGLPLPWLLGSLLVTTATALMKIEPFGHVLGAPTGFRMAVIPIIGVSIGAAFTPEVVRQMPDWWPSLLALVLYIPLAHALGYTSARMLGGADAPTAYYGMMPGGFIEALTLGENAGGDTALLATFQFLRLILCLVMIPLGFTLATGHAVGSASGAVLGGNGHALTLSDWAIMIVAGVVGGVGGRALNLPAGIVIGPMILSAIAHLAGLVHGGPPRWLVDVTQLVVGTTLGTRFAGRSPRILLTGLRVTVVSVGLTLVLATGFAALLHGFVEEPWQAVFLAFAPGGLAEMSLVALSLQISVIYVTAHHVARILLAVLTARTFERLVVKKS